MKPSSNLVRPARPRFRWRRWLLVALGVLVLVIGIPVGKEFYARWQARGELEKVIAELDRSDPRWRLEDIEADRRQVPPDRNSARTVVAAFRLLPKGWRPKIDEEIDKVPPAVALRPDQAEHLEAELKPLGAALHRARRLKDYPLGRYQVHYTPDYFSTQMGDQQHAREVAVLLNLEVALLLHRKQMDQAWSSNQALLNVGRSLGDEPSLISALIRLAIDSLALRSLERILARGEVTRPELRERQKALEKEKEVTLFVIAMRGERAGIDHFLTNVERGKVPLLRAINTLGSGNKNDTGSSWWDPVSEFFAMSMVLNSHATLLRFETRVIEAAKLPPPQRYQELEKVDALFKTKVPKDDKGLILAGLLFPACVKVAQAEQRVHTQLACAAAGLAAERFRLRHSHWPRSLKELVKAGFLNEVPRDLFSGKPLRLRRTTDGLVIYSGGPDGRYDGKALDKMPKAGANPDQVEESTSRLEFRLWDVAHRRKAPPLGKGGD
jgi:hypothetical protein